MELTPQDYAEAFGVELPTQEGQTTENGAVSPQEGQEEQTGQGDGETASEGAQAVSEGTSAENGGTAGEQTGTEMPMEERRRQDFGRRAREQRTQEATQQGRDAIIAEMFAGKTDPYTGKPITTEAEYRAYQKERSQREHTAQLQKAGIQPETIQGFIDQQLSPIRDQLQQAQLSAMRDRAKQVEEASQREIDAQLRLIQADDPSIKSLDDIAAMDTAKDFNAQLKRGATLSEAFYLANRKAIEARKLAAAKTAVMNSMAGKGHLSPVQSGSGQEPVEVPADAKENFLSMMPGATDAEIRAAYAAYLKATK